MTEYFRITGLNNIHFDEGATGPYRVTGGSPPVGMSEPLTRQEVLGILPRLPVGIRSYVLSRADEKQGGLSRITCQINIQGGSDTLMEQYRHELTETLEAAGLYIETRGARGTRAVLRYKMDNVAVGNDSYKTIFYGTVDEIAGRDVLGAKVKASFLQDMKLTLYCESCWRPETAVTLGPNEIYCPSFEENADSLAPNQVADNWTLVGTPTPIWEPIIVLHGCWSQKIFTNDTLEGIDSTPFPSGAVNRTAVAYAWIYKAGGGDIRVRMCETGVGIIAESLLSTPGWQTATGKDGNTWSRVVVSGTMPNNGNHHLSIVANDASTMFYVDKCYWEWDTLVAPDEWISHYLAYNHFDARWLAGAGDAGHINYTDVDDLKGDVEAKTRLLMEFDVKADYDAMMLSRVFRRTRGTAPNFTSVLEAESAISRSNWANAADAKCSNGNKVSNNSTTSGYVVCAVTANLTDNYGCFQVFARLSVTDIGNTRFRASTISSASTGDWQVGQWKYLKIAGALFQLVDLGTFHMPPVDLRSGATTGNLHYKVEYAKDDNDTAECDYILIVPVDECVSIGDLGFSDSLVEGEYFAFEDAADFAYAAAETSGAVYTRALAVKGTFLRLVPNITNRLLFSVDTKVVPNGPQAINEVHGASTNLQMKITIDYLPQYISPLE